MTNTRIKCTRGLYGIRHVPVRDSRLTNDIANNTIDSAVSSVRLFFFR